LINLDGDLFDLLPAFIPSTSTIYAKKHHHPGHCTGFIRFTKDDLFCSHNTWDSYQTMLRIFKHYHFPTLRTDTKATDVLFSSYPGALSSIDDFYVLNSNIFVTETTNSNFNMSLYNALTPESVLSWVRTVTANRLAGSAKEWVQLYVKYNSGTYNNQWIAVDHNLFTPGMKQLLPDTVWVVEQIPGYAESADVTDIVNKDGYWASYNVPYFPYIYNIMGFPGAVITYGPEYSRNCSRANIFQRDSRKVHSLKDVQRIMQYNEYQTDPFSSDNPCNTIAARCDLPLGGYDTSGALDAKATSHNGMLEAWAWAISGPTHQDQPPFVWNNMWSNQSHLGQPTKFDFDWQLMM